MGTPSSQQKRRSDSQQNGNSTSKRTPRPRAIAEAKDCVFELQPGNALHFTGTASLQVKHGSVFVAGHILTAEAGRVPICADAKVGGPLAIETIDPVVQIPRVDIGQAAAVSLIDHTPTAWQSQLAARAEQQSSLSADSAPAANTAQQTFQALPAPEAAATGMQPLSFSCEWQQAAAQLSSHSDAPPRVAVVGSKQTGKSSFARLLVNNLLNTWPAVAFLDTDCGQSEFTPPGLVSLVLVEQLVTGPPHMHPRQPARSYFIGDTSPQINPGLFVRSITSLIDWYAQDLAQQQQGASGPVAAPLVINTHGWIKGAGLEMLTEVLQAASPTHLVQLQSVHSKRNLPPHPSWLQPLLARPFHSILLPAVDALLPPTSPRAPASLGQQGTKPLSPVDSRALSWLAFVRCCLQPEQLASSQPNAWDSSAFAATAVALAQQPPFITPWRSLSVQVMHCAVPRGELPAAINGTVVGMCAAPEQRPPTYKHVLNSSPNSTPLPCLGLGIVRTLDAAAGLVYILTSVDEKQLQHVNTLQVGQLGLPPSLVQAPGLQSPYLALFSLTAEGTGTRSMRSRGNLLRAVHA